MGSEMVPFERALVNSYRPSIVTFLLSLHISQILPLLFSSTPLFPTPPLISPKFPHVCLGIRGSPFCQKQRRCWANCLCNQFPRFPTYVITIHHHRRTTGTTCDRKTALCTELNCAVKTAQSYSFLIILISIVFYKPVQPPLQPGTVSFVK